MEINKKKTIRWILIIGIIVYAVRCTDRFLEIDSCLDLGNIWDYEQNICREDCLRWTKEFGCIKMTEDQVELFRKCRHKGSNCVPEEVFDEICKQNDLPFNAKTGKCDTDFHKGKCGTYSDDWSIPKICLDKIQSGK